MASWAGWLCPFFFGFPALLLLITCGGTGAAGVAPAAAAGRVVVPAGRPPPDAHHVVGGHRHDVSVVVAGRHLVDDDAVLVQGDLPRVLQVVVLQFGPHEPDGGLHDLGDGGRGVAAELGQVVQPQGALVVAASDQTRAWKKE